MKLITHNDLDGLGCRLVLEELYDFDEVIHSSYKDLDYYLKNVRTNRLFITDINFESKEAYRILNQRLKGGDTIIHIDHHNYTEKQLLFLEKLKEKYKFKSTIDKSRSATMITFDLVREKLKKKLSPQRFKNLEKFVYYTNVYDLWKTENPDFKKAFMINDIMNKKGLKNFYYILKKNSYTIPDEIKREYKHFLEEKEKYYRFLKENDLIISDDGFMVVFLPEKGEYASHINIDFDFKFLIIVYNNSGKVSIRMKDLEEEKAKKIFDEIQRLSLVSPSILNFGGHTFAMGMNLQYEKLDEIVQSLHTIYQMNR